MEDKKVQFAPFQALNSFMRPDYRIQIVRRTLALLPQIPEEIRFPVEQIIHDKVRVVGFRNSLKAPTVMKIKPTCDEFEKNSALVAGMISVWSAGNPELRQQVFDFLTSRDWLVLPPDADRTKLPGFLTVWPKGEDFEVLNDAFRVRYPDTEYSDDDISLMVVWICGRLPIEFKEKDAQTSEEGELAPE